MRYSETEARSIIEKFKKNSIDDLDTLFNRGALPEFETLEGDTAGVILALNSENPWCLTCVIKIAFKSPLGRWTGKKFNTLYNESKKGYGINLFNRLIYMRTIHVYKPIPVYTSSRFFKGSA